MSEKKIRTLDQARQRIAELEAQLAGKHNITSANKPTPAVARPKIQEASSKIAGKTSKEIIADCLPLALADKISTLKATLENETDSKKRLLALTNTEEDLRVMSAKEKDPVKQVAITRSLSKVQKRYALGLFQNKEEWAKRNQIIEDLD